MQLVWHCNCWVEPKGKIQSNVQDSGKKLDYVLWVDKDNNFEIYFFPELQVVYNTKKKKKKHLIESIWPNFFQFSV